MNTVIYNFQGNDCTACSPLATDSLMLISIETATNAGVTGKLPIKFSVIGVGYTTTSAPHGDFQLVFDAIPTSLPTKTPSNSPTSFPTMTPLCTPTAFPTKKKKKKKFLLRDEIHMWNLE